MNDKKIAILAVVGGAILGSAVAAMTKKGLVEIPVFSFAFFRFVVASLTVLPFFYLNKYHRIPHVKQILPVSLIAAVNTIFYTVGVKYTAANSAGVMYAAVPLLCAIILYFLYKERLSEKKELGLIVGFIGVLFITLLPLIQKGNPFSGNIWGNLLLTGAILFWSLYLVYSKRLQEKYSPFLITCNFIFIATIVFFPFFLWDLYVHAGWWHRIDMWSIFSLFYIGVVATVINYTLNQYAVKHGGAVMAGTAFYILPIFAFVVNYFLLGEVLTSGFIFGSLLALVGTYLVVRK